MRSRHLSQVVIFIVTMSILASFFGAKCGICQTGQKNNQPKTLGLLFWGSPVDKPGRELFQRAFLEFEAAHPSIHIKANFYWPEHYKTKLRLLMAIDKAPDIFMTWSGDFLKPYVEAGKVMPLDKILDQNPVWRASFMDNAFETLSFNGQVYGIPIARVTTVLFYNKAIFARLGLEIPQTYEALKDVIETLRSAGITPIAFGNKDPWMGGMFAGQIIQRLGGKDLFKRIKTHDVEWTSPPFVKAGAIIEELIRLGAFPDAPNTRGYLETVEMFYQGKAAMMLLGSWTIQYLISNNSLPENTVGIMNFPAFNSGTGSMNVWMGQTDMNLCINNKSARKNEAVAFLKWITNERYQRDLMHVAGLLPATRVTVDEKRYIRPELLELIDMQKEMEAMYPFPDIELGGFLGQAFIDGVKKIFDGESSNGIFRQLHEKSGS